jgi:hypothetical protein
LAYPIMIQAAPCLEARKVQRLKPNPTESN